MIFHGIIIIKNIALVMYVVLKLRVYCVYLTVKCYYGTTARQVKSLGKNCYGDSL